MTPPAPRLLVGHNGPWWWRRPFWLNSAGVHTHKHVIGVTGQGKSKLLASLFVQLIEQGAAAALVDPHSDLATEALALLADKRLLGNVIYVPFNRSDRYLPFNVLKQPYDDHSVARNIVESFKRVWPALSDGAAPMFENVMLAATLTLIQNNRPLTDAPRLIMDKRYRERLLANVRDPQVVQFFHGSFDNLPPRDQLDQSQSSLRRIFLLTFSPTLRYSLGQSANALDFRHLMDTGTPAIFDLGGLDEETQKLLGALITVGYEVAALSRATTPQTARRPYHLFLDEFAQFTSTSETSFARILSEARKYGLFLTLAHQTWSQVSARLQGALQNTTTLAFKLGRSDAEWMAKQLGSFDPYRIKHLVESGQERSHPVFFGVQDTFESFTAELEQLKPQQAYVKAPWRTGFPWHRPIIRTEKVKTLPVPAPRSSPAEVEKLKDQFAKRLMTPRDEVVATVDDFAPTSAEPPPRYKKRY